jgi:uncharacterized membrane protein
VIDLVKPKQFNFQEIMADYNRKFDEAKKAREANANP